MRFSPGRRAAIKYTALAVGAAAVGYASTVGFTWLRYGRRRPARDDERDDLLDRFMSDYDVVERHSVSVGAPAAITLAAACELDLLREPLTRAIVRTRELILGGRHDDEGSGPTALLAQMRALGWGVLAEVPGREVVVGAVTRPWEADVTFRAIAPDAFAAFDEKDYVKIVWTLRADPLAGGGSIFRTETRAAATDAAARARFRWYWAFFSPGIRLIRRAAVRRLKSAAERRAREGAPGRAA